MALIELLIHQPQALGRIPQNTPVWVWGLLAGLVALGLSQARARQAGVWRVSLLPAAMLLMSLLGVVGDFGRSGLMGPALAAWGLGAGSVLLALRNLAPARGSWYDAGSHRFHLPGSWLPMQLILAIFSLKYAVGIELALRPQASQSAAFALPVCLAYGALSALFAARALALQRLVSRALIPHPVV